MVTFLIMSLPLMFVIMTAVVDGQQYWRLNYGPSYVCALKGSTVKMSCVLNYPHDHELRTAFWTKLAVADGKTSTLCLNSEKRERVQCFHENEDTYSITLTNVREADKHVYYCRFTTNRGTWMGIPGAQLDVTDLQVETQQSVKEGDSVILTCKSSCSLPEQTTFNWYRNTQIVTTRIMNVNQLQLQSVSRNDAGKYQCAVSGYERLISQPVILKVEWDDGLQDWGVNYSPSYVCAVKGSKVKMSCTVKYPHNHKLKTVFWTKPAVSVTEPPNLCTDRNNRERVECFHEYKDTSSVTLTNVREADKHIYYCRFTTNTGGGKWTGVPGAQLDVTDLQVETQQSVKEGDSVTLTCKSSCSLPEQTTFIWFRNTQIVTTGIMNMNQLQLQSVSLNDSGNYECAVSGNQLKSSPVHLNVEYPPKSISVSISPSGEIVEGDSVTLICSSDSNPSAEISWYKGETFLKSGDSYSFTNIKSEDSGIYKCSASNKHGSQASTAVTVNVRYPPKSISVFISPSGEIVEGDSVTLICSSDSNPPAEISWIKEGKSVESGQIYNISNISSDHSGEYKCKSTNKHGAKDSDFVTLNVMYKPRNVVINLNSSEIVEGDSVTLNCSSDSNPPALIFSWFKENQSSSVASGQSLSISSFNSSHSGRYYCEAQNKYGSERSASVSVTVKGVQKAALHTVTGIVVGCGGLIFILIIIIVFIKKKRRDGGAEAVRQNQQEDHVDRSAETALSNDHPVYSLVSDNQTDDLYANIKAKKPKRSGREQTEKDSGDAEDVQYVSVHHFKNKDMKKTEKTIELQHLSDPNRFEDVIYSSVK